MVAKYAQINGHADIPMTHYTRDVNGRRVALGRWAGYIKGRYRAGLLSVEQAKAFEIVPHWDWNARGPGSKPNLEMRRDVLTYRSMRMSMQQIADRVGLSRQRVHQILKDKTK